MLCGPCVCLLLCLVLSNTALMKSAEEGAVRVQRSYDVSTNRALRTKVESLENSVTSLKNKVSRLENSLENSVTSLRNKVSGLENSLENSVTSQKNKVSSLENSVTSLKNKVSSLENSVTSQKNKVSSLENSVTSQKNKVSSLENSVTSLKNKVSRLENSLHNVKKATSRAVAFTARMSGDRDRNLQGVSLGHQQTVIFNLAITNVGDAYNTQTGIFTAPVAATFAFFLTQMGVGDSPNIYLDIVKNGVRLDQVFAEGRAGMQGSTLLTTHLREGDQVWVRQYRGNAVRGGFWTVFTGYLLHAD